MKKSNSGFYGFLAVLIIGAAFFYSWKSILPKYQSAKSQIESTKNETAAAQAKLDSLTKVKSDLAAMGTLPDQLFVAVPSDKDTPNLVTELEKIFTSLSIATPTIQITDTSADAAAAAPVVATTSAAIPGAVGISFSVDGTFEQFSNLIKTLEKDIRFTNIKSVSITAAEDGSLTMTLQGEVYKRVTSSAAGTGTAATPAASSSSTE